MWVETRRPEKELEYGLREGEAVGLTGIVVQEG